MYPIPAHTVELVLEYISPLTDPLPPHLISTPLRQRHHFLQISPSSPADYLCWPSPDNAEIIDLLYRLPSLSDQHFYPTRYTSDAESTFAHVQISSSAQGLRMVFHWDVTQSWKYHDLCLMPFPHSSFSTPQESLARCSAFEAGHLSHPLPDLATESGQTNGDDDDSYWASYGATGDNLPSPSPRQSAPDTIGEDAYWAQYASVQGSADSTVPSPLPVNRKHQPVNPSDTASASQFPPQDEPVIDVPVDVINSCPQPGPPSPNMLAHLLGRISPRKDVYSPVPGDLRSLQSPATSAVPSPEQTTADSELVTPPLPDGHLDAAIVSPVIVKVNGVPPSKYASRSLQTEDKALTESIKGLYYLWKSGRKGEPDEKDRNVFLQIVQDAVTYDQVD